MKPWREIAIPHNDVLAGTFQQSEFAADITAVRMGKAPPVYQDARVFFDRTFITEGMRLLLIQVAERLNGRDGEPVVQLQTAFGGGKTHTMLAVYHLATRACPLADLPGIPSLLTASAVSDVPRARVAILDGMAHSPGQPWKNGKVEVHTLWGELAMQLGGVEAFDLVRQADETGTSPGKETLRQVLAKAAPCVVLVDELVTYVRQFHDGRALSGGTYDSNLSFIQALTEATKLVPNAILLASLPESEVEVGSSLGVAALRALEKLFGRVQALWKPVGIEESFEIVRRRLFEPIRDEVGRDEVCTAFATRYRSEGVRLPSECREVRYQERLKRAYPIHPEVFDRLYEDWTTLDGFQRTRGVLKLMAKVIYRLWKDQNKDLMLLPSSLPLYDSSARNELTYHLGAGWDPVIDKDIDGEHSEAAEIDTKDPRFGAHQAARRVARTLFLGSAPSAVATSGGGTKGIERGRILLGSLQPGQSSATFNDALNRLADRLHYLNNSGDKTQDGTRFWFDVRTNLRREMEDRKGRYGEQSEVRGKIADVVSKIVVGKELFDAIHIFTPHGDVPDDSVLRLVVLDPNRPYSKQEVRPATDAVLDYLKNNGTKPRFKGNRLVFVAPDAASLGRLRDAARTALAWASIVSDIAAGRLVIDRLQEAQAKKETETAEAVVHRAARECYRWVLSPTLLSATQRDIQVEGFPMNTAGASYMSELTRVCEENELVISTWSPIHLRSRLKELYWKDGKVAVKALVVWEDIQKYLYLPRLKSRSVFEQAVLKGATGDDFFGTAYGQDGEKFEGFKLGDAASVQVDDTLLLIEPSAAMAYKMRLQQVPVPPQKPQDPEEPDHFHGDPIFPPIDDPKPPDAVAKQTKFFGTVDVNPGAAKLRLITLADEIIALLASDPNATVKVSVEISAEFPKGAPDHIRRGVSENAGQLGFKAKDWE
jgi:predicted AAA+ superfamily ATPase